MTVNHSSVLSVEYFEAYFKLVLASREPLADNAKRYIKKNFFKDKECYYGEQTRRNFVSAFNKIKDKRKNS
ncbi:hypothetical protein [Peribacillus frigoritolerans]|uniref:hypothetical protein n=1 Tax=Peribacillus frigoritolerans TaxID=450367 RepID=UPI0022816C9C|nr:hypothetical protein [Peribacillus frigoritolerans]MCY9141963.1 hypothetical protein [Peribacillus frigoritolerans]MED4687671.1 hypothetical protein [Peribacillus frigoritolerans]